MRAEDMVVTNSTEGLIGMDLGLPSVRKSKFLLRINKIPPRRAVGGACPSRLIVLLSVLRIPLGPMCQEGIQLVRHPLIYPMSRRFRATKKAWKWPNSWETVARSSSRAMGR